MAVTLSSFKASFPEFDLGTDAAHDALVTAKLAEAEGMVDRTLFQSTTQADSCVSYCAAHLLACSPGGINARLAKDKKGDVQTLYWPTYQQLKRLGAILANRTT